MTAYVALLRGINVNGITITMSSLRDLFRGLGFAGVETVLASGNVLFEAGPGESDASALKARIQAALSEAYDYEAWIVLQGVETLGRIVDAYPFDPNREGWHPYVVSRLIPRPWPSSWPVPTDSTRATSGSPPATGCSTGRSGGRSA
ncbi:DUF1697 domain-containing protein [Cryobacterium sp. Sr8]|uniref:DUF1697 domain-containing protein n=1 Tax=Cryobacterium sp. Sr8 TaxID=1259203 RepID=UPI0018E0B5B8|nr:DUF1697 domain-containing protein [Cryobacterium sp. Sr8]